MNAFISRGFLTALAIALMSMFAMPAFAQDAPVDKEAHRFANKHANKHAHKRGGMMKGQRGLMKGLVPPRMALEFQDELELTDAQVKQLEAIGSETRANGKARRGELRQEIATLSELLAQPKVNEAAALAQLDRIIALESQQKRARFETMIRTKNILTDAQVARLGELRKERRGEQGQRGEKRQQRRHKQR